MNYWHRNKSRIVIGLAALVAAALGADPALAAACVIVGDMEPTDLKALNTAMQKAFGTLQDGLKKQQDEVEKIIDQIKRGDDVHAKSADEMKKLGEENKKAQEDLLTKFNATADRLRELEQKTDKRLGFEFTGEGGGEGATPGEMFVKSESYKGLMKSTNGGVSLKGWDGESFHISRKTAILNPVTPTATNQALVRPDRQAGIIMPGLRRFTIRDLLPNLRTSSNLVEFASELLFTSNAGPQWDGSSPDLGIRDGALKNESALTFALSNTPVITIAHYIPASRQILADADMLAGYINARLIYGLKFEEEDELLNGAGTNGKLTGLRTSQTTFTGGVTNQTALDTLLKALTQVSLSYFDASGFVLHPIDWQNILLLKDSQNRYLFADPHGQATPMVWGKPVVATQSIAQGQFLCGAFDLAAAIFDREDVTIRTAEQHSDWFARNLVAILCEERLALAIFRTASMVGGAISYAG